ncbi:hypothetical protein [Selenomonas sp. KH1T6]|uniref:hypothetical protein n=1 Tax=Selenomonas sp. KH1T6 TaxID=3158784 RepID=UPI0008A7D1E7|nr:hypothetical protein SAMN05216583_1222 [Selenomonas ruminantium]
MKLSENVTRDMLADVIEQALKDLEGHRVEARVAYAADKSDSFHMYMDVMFGLAVELLHSRLLTVYVN